MLQSVDIFCFSVDTSMPLWALCRSLESCKLLQSFCIDCCRSVDMVVIDMLDRILDSLSEALMHKMRVRCLSLARCYTTPPPPLDLRPRPLDPWTPRPLDPRPQTPIHMQPHAATRIHVCMLRLLTRNCRTGRRFFKPSSQHHGKSKDDKACYRATRR
jgi:hypothetical protein